MFLFRSAYNALMEFVELWTAHVAHAFLCCYTAYFRTTTISSSRDASLLNVHNMYLSFTKNMVAVARKNTENMQANK